MWFLYLDESGDLGFDFVNRRPSKFFTISILAIKGADNNYKFSCAVKKTLKRKLNYKKNKKRFVGELKGSATIIDVKKYFYQQVKNIPFAIFSITLNKIKVYEKLTREKDRVYNFIARKVLDQIRFENADLQVDLMVDKSRGQKQTREFNEYIIKQLNEIFL